MYTYTTKIVLSANVELNKVIEAHINEFHVMKVSVCSGSIQGCHQYHVTSSVRNTCGRRTHSIVEQDNESQLEQSRRVYTMNSHEVAQSHCTAEQGSDTHCHEQVIGNHWGTDTMHLLHSRGHDFFCVLGLHQGRALVTQSSGNSGLLGVLLAPLGLPSTPKGSRYRQRFISVSVIEEVGLLVRSMIHIHK
ncbi:Hypothetical protein GLP15_2691 [Giardia lamblia P15]|uniref:Uncharacterized protein n=1 Tax=Giardia intestinalis (strain P15) TaxID=658858 RepID=E1F479_GIAIA|nr:Hypothetical protein GLP15_2691 [Giardia lamblia P15]